MGILGLPNVLPEVAARNAGVHRPLVIAAAVALVLVVAGGLYESRRTRPTGPQQLGAVLAGVAAVLVCGVAGIGLFQPDIRSDPLAIVGTVSGTLGVVISLLDMATSRTMLQWISRPAGWLLTIATLTLFGLHLYDQAQADEPDKAPTAAVDSDQSPSDDDGVQIDYVALLAFVSGTGGALALVAR